MLYQNNATQKKAEEAIEFSNEAEFKKEMFQR